MSAIKIALLKKTLTLQAACTQFADWDAQRRVPVFPSLVSTNFALALVRDYLLEAQRKTIISSKLRAGQMAQTKFVLGSTFAKLSLIHKR